VHLAVAVAVTESVTESVAVAVAVAVQLTGAVAGRNEDAVRPEHDRPAAGTAGMTLAR